MCNTTLAIRNAETLFTEHVKGLSHRKTLGKKTVNGRRQKRKKHQGRFSFNFIPLAFCLSFSLQSESEEQTKKE